MMNKKGLCTLVGMLAACIAVSVLAQPAPIANVTTANEETVIFDTGPSSNPYPSIAGTHNGTITPAKTLNVSKVFTYSCRGTGGHSEYVWIHGNGVNETVTWGGYSEEWHKLSFNQSFLLVANKTYYYVIKTGSYPQIHHRDELEAEGGMGIINCTSFVDANGRSYNNWIPTIRLEGYFVDGVHNIDTGKNFATIQSAIEDNETQDGHTIVVYAGTYLENVVVTKRLTLQGIGMPTVDANGSGSAITVSADGCIVKGFNVTGAGTGSEYDYYAGIKVTSDCNTLVNNTASNSNYGIGLWWVSDNTVTNNIVSSNRYCGILLDAWSVIPGLLGMCFTNNNTLTNNTVSNNAYGIHLRTDCCYNTVRDNTVTNNKQGIQLVVSSHNILMNNIVSNNMDGVTVYPYYSINNIITNNTISSNRRYGIKFTYGASGNHIYHNNIVNNTNQACTDACNMWDKSPTIGGNYWSDHECTGNPSNGSQPYYIPSGGIDNYPFQNPWGWKET